MPTRRQAIIWNTDDYFTDAYMRHSASMNWRIVCVISKPILMIDVTDAVFINYQQTSIELGEVIRLYTSLPERILNKLCAITSMRSPWPCDKRLSRRGLPKQTINRGFVFISQSTGNRNIRYRVCKMRTLQSDTNLRALNLPPLLDDSLLINSFRPSDAYMRRLSNHHCFR